MPFEHEIRISTRYKGTGKPGKPGPDGKKADPPQSNVAGKPGRKDIQDPDNLNDDYFGEQLTPLLGRMMLRQATLDHLNGNLEQAAEKLAWLHKLLGPVTPRAANSAPLIDADVPGSDTVPDHGYEQLRIQTALQVQRLQRGLDAYGNTPTFIPMLTYRAYEAYIGRWLNTAREAEELYNEYYHADRDQKTARNAAEAALRNLDLTIVNLQHEILEIEAYRNELRRNINDLQDPLQNAAAALLRAGDDFKDAVRRKTNGCDFGDVLKAGAAIVSFAKGATGAVGGVGPSLAAIKDVKSDTFKHLEIISEKLEVVSGNLATVSKAYNSLKDVLADGPAPDLPSDAAKIVAERDKIMKTIDEFKSLAGAKAYRKAIDSYIGLVLLRNAKIMEYDALALQVEEAESRIEQSETDKVEIRGMLATTQDPHLPELKDFMDRSLDMHKSELVRALHYAQRALAYMALTEQEIDLGRQTVFQLQHIHSILDKQLHDASEGQGRAPATLEFGKGVPTFSLKALVGEQGIEKLRNKEPVMFTLPDEPFSDYHHVYATRVRAVFNGVSKEGQVARLRLEHSGHARLIDRSGELREFTHAARVAAHVRDSDQDGSFLGQSDEFISLTPYGPWQASLALNSNRDIDLEQMTDITLEFEIKYLPN